MLFRRLGNSAKTVAGSSPAEGRALVRRLLCLLPSGFRSLAPACTALSLLWREEIAVAPAVWILLCLAPRYWGSRVLRGWWLLRGGSFWKGCGFHIAKPAVLPPLTTSSPACLLSTPQTEQTAGFKSALSDGLDPSIGGPSGNHAFALS
jgi:hypothetical protein